MNGFKFLSPDEKLMRMYINVKVVNIYFRKLVIGFLQHCKLQKHPLLLPELVAEQTNQKTLPL